jgi:hypothetical protein
MQPGVLQFRNSDIDQPAVGNTSCLASKMFDSVDGLLNGLRYDRKDTQVVDCMSTLLFVLSMASADNFARGCLPIAPLGSAAPFTPHVPIFDNR